MVCRICRTENPDGRETCIRCGEQLLDIRGLMTRDRWVGKAIGAAVIGIFGGGGLGAAAGLAIGGLTGGVENAILGAWAGIWIGAVLGGILGFIAGVALNVNKY